VWFVIISTEGNVQTERTIAENRVKISTINKEENIYYDNE